MWGGPNHLIPSWGLLLSFGEQREGSVHSSPLPGLRRALFLGQHAGRRRRGFPEALCGGVGSSPPPHLTTPSPMWICWAHSWVPPP